MDDNQKMFWLSIKKPVSDMAERLGKWTQLAPNKPDLPFWFARMWQGSVLQQPSVWEQRGSTMKTMWYPSLYNIETMTKGTNFSYFVLFFKQQDSYNISWRFWNQKPIQLWWQIKVFFFFFNLFDKILSTKLNTALRRAFFSWLLKVLEVFNDSRIAQG